MLASMSTILINVTMPNSLIKNYQIGKLETEQLKMEKHYKNTWNKLIEPIKTKIEIPSYDEKSAKAIESKSSTYNIYYGGIIAFETIPTSDGGFAMAGMLYSKAKLADKKEVMSYNPDSPDGIIVKYEKASEETYKETGEEYKVKWISQVSGLIQTSSSSGALIKSIVETKDGGYAVIAILNSPIIKIDDTIIQNESPFMIIKYSEKGKTQWYKNIGTEGNAYVFDLCATHDGGIAITGFYGGETLELDENNILYNRSYNAESRTDGMIIKYDIKGKIQLCKNITGEYSERAYYITELSDGTIIGLGESDSEMTRIDYEKGPNQVSLLTAPGYGPVDKRIVIILNEEQGFQDIVDTDKYITQLVETKDNAVVVVEQTDDNMTSILLNCTLGECILTKYTFDGLIEWENDFSGEYESVSFSNVATTRDGGIVFTCVGEFPVYQNGKKIDFKENKYGLGSATIKLNEDGQIIFKENNKIDIDPYKYENMGLMLMSSTISGTMDNGIITTNTLAYSPSIVGDVSVSSLELMAHADTGGRRN